MRAVSRVGLGEALAVALEQDGVPLVGIDVEVERGVMTADEMLEYRIRSVPGGIPRTATASDLRAFEGQNAGVLQFFPQMQIATGAGCGSCLMSNGRFDPDRWVLDDRVMSFDEFRSYAVGELCRIDVVTVQIPQDPMEKGFVMAYTCGYLRRVALGEETLPILLTSLWGR